MPVKGTRGGERAGAGKPSANPVTVDVGPLDIVHDPDLREQVKSTLNQIDLTGVIGGKANFDQVPPNGQICIALAAFGWSQRATAELLGIDASGVSKYLQRYDPQCILRGDPVLALVLRSAMLRARADQVLWSITPEVIQAAPLQARTRAYRDLIDRSDTLAERAQAEADNAGTGQYEQVMAQLIDKPQQIEAIATQPGCVDSGNHAGSGGNGRDAG